MRSPAVPGARSARVGLIAGLMVAGLAEPETVVARAGGRARRAANGVHAACARRERKSARSRAPTRRRRRARNPRHQIRPTLSAPFFWPGSLPGSVGEVRWPRSAGCPWTAAGGAAAPSARRRVRWCAAALPAVGLASMRSLFCCSRAGGLGSGAAWAGAAPRGPCRRHAAARARSDRPNAAARGAKRPGPS